MKTQRWIMVAVLATATMMLALPLGSTAQDGNDGGSNAANKAAASGSALEILSAPLVEGFESQEVTILDTQIKTSKPQDLIISVTLECALWTNVRTDGNDMAESMARVKVWVEIDGAPVAVSSDDDGEDQGKVVFCDRTHRQEVTNLDNENHTLEQYLRTRTANGFNWVVLDAGSATHDVEVIAQLETEVTGLGMAQAGIGKRTLVIDPVRFPVGTTI